MTGKSEVRGSNQVTRFLTRPAEVPTWTLLIFLLVAAMSMVDLVARHGWFGVVLVVVSLSAGFMISRYGDRS